MKPYGVKREQIPICKNKGRCRKCKYWCDRDTDLGGSKKDKQDYKGRERRKNKIEEIINKKE